MASISEAAVADIRKTMDSVTADPNKIPGCVLTVVDKDGNEIFTHASGTRGVDTKEPMTMENVFWIASCTKMVCGIAVMQLVEKGELDLDDANKVEQLCPELKAVKILKGVDENGKSELVEKKNRITLRMLLTHTAGFGYTIFNDDLRRNAYPAGGDEFSGRIEDILSLPLVHEPGEAWQYGVSIDWAGICVERVSGMRLGDYFQKNIVEPLGLKNVNMIPTAEMKSRLAYMNTKVNGTMLPRDHLHRAAIVANPEEQTKLFHSAGAGLFAPPTEFCKIISTLLNAGKSPHTGATILSASSTTQLFDNQIPHFPNFGRTPWPAAKPHLTNPIPELYPQPHDQPQGWNLLGMLTIHSGPTGRGRDTTWWAGLANLYWWCDREKGVGGIMASQILPFADSDVLGLWGATESAIYAALDKGAK